MPYSRIIAFFRAWRSKQKDITTKEQHWTVKWEELLQSDKKMLSEHINGFFIFYLQNNKRSIFWARRPCRFQNIYHQLFSCSKHKSHSQISCMWSILLWLRVYHPFNKLVLDDVPWEIKIWELHYHLRSPIWTYFRPCGKSQSIRGNGYLFHFLKLNKVKTAKVTITLFRVVNSQTREI